MWAFQSVLLLSIVMIFSIYLSIHKINNSSFYQYVWSWIINNDFSLDFGYLIDPLTSIMSILITTIGIMVLICSDNYMDHDQGYLRFLAYMSFFSTSMLGLVTSSNLIQIYIFWELVGPCSYLLIGFWSYTTRDFGLLLGILGFYWITGSFEFRDLFEIFNNLIYKNEVNSLFVTLCAVLLFAGAVAKSAQFPLHVCRGNFSCSLTSSTFRVIPYIMCLISVIEIIIVLLGATLALAKKDIKRGLAYSTMSQLGYMMLALGMGSYRSSLFHLITHAYSKALLLLGSESIIHSMETIVGYSPDKRQYGSYGRFKKTCTNYQNHIFIRYTFSLGYSTSCFLDHGGIIAFYMFWIYLLTLEGHLNVHFQNYGGKHKTPFYSLSLWAKNRVKKNSCLLTMNNNESTYFFSKTKYPIDKNGRKMTRPFMTIAHFEHKAVYSYPYESDNTMQFPIFVLGLFTLFVGSIGIPFNQEGGNLDILSKWLDAVLSVGIAYFGIFIASLLYKPIYSSLNNFEILWDKIINGINDWSYNRAYIDAFYTRFFVGGIRGLAEFTHFFDRRIIDGMTNGVGVISFIVGERIKYIRGGRISSYLSCI
ncbi:unnamed protein product [Withania somnifera]